LIPGDKSPSVEQSESSTPVVVNLAGLRLISPSQGSAYLFSTGFESSAQRIPIEAVGGESLVKVDLYLDGELFASLSAPPYQAWWPLAVGEHRVWAEGVLQSGERVTSEVITFKVE